MFESGKKRNAAKKAYEIAYALFRISAKIEESSIKERLESEAINLLISANAGSYGNAANAIAVIEALVKFAIDLNIVSISNGDILLREIAFMHEIIIECLDKSDEVDVSKFFSSVVPADADTQVVPSEDDEDETVVLNSSTEDDVVLAKSEPQVFSSEGEAVSDIALQQSNKDAERRDLSSKVQRYEKEKSGNVANNLKSGNRQIVILDRIRQSGNCKLKEIQEILPDCSERTIRYDLEDLIERNLVERVGSGGPSVAYRIRQSSAVSV